MTPSHIGQYRILRKIGAGGMGLVYLGEHTLLGRRAAIKTLLPVVAANRAIVDRFFNEARATSAISDPGVIQVFDFGYHVDGTAYIVMEFLEGEALSARIDRLGKLPVGDALRLARQLTGSLAVAHALDIVHRDLKPENVFLVKDPEAQGGERTKILDFGICKVGNEEDTALTQSGALVGTPVYMSPEQCRGVGGVDQRSDIYAFGCLLFHMLTGRPPFVGDATGDLIVAHLHEAPPVPSRCVAGLPPAIDALVLGCLAKAPEDRHQSMTELQHAISELYAQLDHVDVPVAAAPQTMALGRGFRSLYDGNFGSRAGGVQVLPGTHALPWLRTSPPPRTPLPGVDAVSPRRMARALLASVLVVGVVIGLLTTSYLIYSADRREEAEARRQAALSERVDAQAERVERAGPPRSRAPELTASAGANHTETPAVLAATTPPVIHVDAVSSAAPPGEQPEDSSNSDDGDDSARRGDGKLSRGIDRASRRFASSNAMDRTHSVRETSRETKKAAKPPRPRSEPAAPARSVTASAPVVRAPAAAPPSAAAPPPVASPLPAASPTAAPPAGAPPSASTPPARPASPPAEDLYDTR